MLVAQPADWFHMHGHAGEYASAGVVNKRDNGGLVYGGAGGDVHLLGTASFSGVIAALT